MAGEDAGRPERGPAGGGRHRGPDAIAVEHKAENDFVTQMDRLSERIIMQRLTDAFPEDGFFGEEGGMRDQRKAGGFAGSSIPSTAPPTISRVSPPIPSPSGISTGGS